MRKEGGLVEGYQLKQLLEAIYWYVNPLYCHTGENKYEIRDPGNNIPSALNVNCLS